MKKSGAWKKIRPFAVISLILVIGLLSTGCISGIMSIGWSGVVIEDDTIFTGSREGALVSVNISDGSRLKSEFLKGESSTGLFGCSTAAYTGGGCSGGSSGIAIYGTPAVTEDLIYMAGYNGKIYAYNRDNLAVRWVYPREGYVEPIVAGPVVDNGKVFIGDSEGVFRALDAATGNVAWEFVEEDTNFRERIWGTAAVYDDVVYFGSFNKNLYALNASDGSVKWTFSAGGAIIATPLIEGDTLYIGSFDQTMYALNVRDGSVRWEFTGDGWFWSEPVIVDGVLYAANLEGHVYSINSSTGTLIREYDFNYGIAANPVIAGDTIVFANREGAFYTISTVTGEDRLLVDLEITINGPLTIQGDIIYLQTDTFEITRINALNGSVLQSYLLAG